MIYLDNSATTKVDSRVVEAMLPYLQEEYGNPSAKYYTLAENAKKAVEESRQHIAKLINSEQDEIIFTSGASESNNFVLKGIADFYHNKGNHIITSAIEHSSVLEACKYLETKGYKVTYLKVDKYGQVNPEDLENTITKETILVSIMWGNNEIGTLNKVKELAQICNKHNVFFHSDATQVLGKVKVDVQDIPVDFLSFSAHKLHGPKGIGACYIRKDDLGLKREITPLIHGGGQEFGYRAGTLCTHNIVGLGKAAEIYLTEMEANIIKILKIEGDFLFKLKNEFIEMKVNGHPTEKIPGLLSITIPKLNNEVLIRKLKNKVALSTGSACSFNKPSHVLKAIGLTNQQIKNTFRFSLSKYNLTNLDTLISLLKE